ncbi:type II secretion system minor pseudopilin GspJ [Gammaproteobacteria bacterium]|nr:type II secretion system minor pseudopilin GspJ [Gammaproteobacteria bacterium]
MKNKKGFTLLEILVALFIFSIVSIIMISGLKTVLTSQSITDKSSTKFNQLQTTLLFLSRDIEQIIDRSITNSKKISEPSLTGTTESLSFTRIGLVNPKNELQRSTLQRVRYSLNKNKIIKETWQSIDQTSKSVTSSKILINNINKLNFQYLDHKGNLNLNWPSLNDKGSNSPLPKAIIITINIKNMGKIIQTYIIPVSGVVDENK